MTAKQYQDRGYRMSLQVQKAEIDRAERDVCMAYIVYLYMGVSAGTDEDIKQFVDRMLQMMSDDSAEWAGLQGSIFHTIAGLTCLLIAQRKGIATRSGGKTPTAINAMQNGGFDDLEQYAKDAAMYIEAIAQYFERAIDDMDNSERDMMRKMYREQRKGMKDICGVYFRSNFFYN